MKIKKLISLLLTLVLCGCASSYKSTWDCPKAKGIGCSSVEYADQVARDQIVFNKTKSYRSEQQDATQQGATQQGAPCTKDCEEQE